MHTLRAIPPLLLMSEDGSWAVVQQRMWVLQRAYELQPSCGVQRRAGRTP
ncbi:hypothetical protein [Methermicoccus shengliensis]|uniref:Uncharacterized protein n=1 Tax=Methermicoccus shengliensis TaxID=660064 RepID=A0A832RTS5_9EURY|nr:hypothetical protein [Methermicoccus shengliensis]HIH70075.1 hypothetical protein [Methermicoccus shengliensis]